MGGVEEVPAACFHGDLYIADDNAGIPRILRIFRTDWPKEQPVNGYAEQFLPTYRVNALILDYARRYIETFGSMCPATRGRP